MSWRHGTHYGYAKKGCRCDKCRLAESRHKRAWRARRTPAYIRELASNRERKRTYTGHCIDCGQPTHYNGHGIQASLRCVACGNRAEGLLRRGIGRNATRLLELLATGPKRNPELMDTLGLDHNNLNSLLHRMRKYGLVERPKRGLYALAEPVTEEAGKPAEGKAL